MSTLNVQDYGAVGDGSSDDTEAIQSAIDDTSEGDTVYIPATADYYKVTSGSRAAVQVQTAADNVTIEGDGEGSVIKLGDTTDSKNQGAFGAEGDGPKMNGILVRNLVFSGNNSVNGNDSANGVALYPGGTGHDITFRNIICEDSASVGFSNRGVSKVTVENLTTRNNNLHGIDFTANEDPNVTYDMEARGIKSINNGGVGMDFHRGKHLIEDFYVANSKYGNKIGASGGYPESVKLRNGQIVDSQSSGWRSTTNDAGTTVEFDNVQILNPAYSGIYLADDLQYTFTNDVLIENGNTVEKDGSWGVFVTDSADLTVNGNLRIQDTNVSEGIHTGSSKNLEISNYYHWNNDEGDISTYNSGGLSIGEQIEEESEYLAVPSASDVGAFTATDSTDDTSSSEDEQNSSDKPIFDDWTPKWDAGTSDWSVSSASSNIEDSILELNAGSAGRHGLSNDVVGTATDVDILGLVRVPSNDDGSSSWCRLIGRGSGTAGNETGYFVAFRDTPTFGISKYVDGGSTLLTNATADFTPGNWLYVRFNISGSELKARYWGVDQQEPSDWLLTATDNSISESGWVGVGGWSTDTQQWDAFSVATGGETAQLIGQDAVPTVSVSNPIDGETVAGTEQVQLSASDAEDSDDSLTAEYRIDNESWTPLSYNQESGLYEGKWDTTTVDDGKHTLEAAVVDSAGNESTTAISVTTDNAGTGPSVDSLSTVEVETEDEDAEFDVDWQVSDADGDLDTVELELIQDSDSAIEDSATVSVGGENDSGSTRLVAAGDDGDNFSYTATLRVADSEGNATMSTTSVVEAEESNAPQIHRFNVSEAHRPDPHAEISVLWDVSDPDGDLASVDIDVSESNETVQGVSWTLSGAKASDSDSFKIKKGDGKTFDVTLTVTDSTGVSTSLKTSVTA